jgi:hypothetical protein
MIETRGKGKVLVVAKCAVPVFDICEMTIIKSSVEEITQMYPVNATEIFECLETFISLPNNELTGGTDFIEFTYDEEQQNFNFSQVSDALFFHLVLFGRIYDKAETNFINLSIIGLKNCLLECLTDMKDGNMNFKSIPMHNMIFDYMLSTTGEEINFTKLLAALQTEMVIKKPGQLNIAKTE